MADKVVNMRLQQLLLAMEMLAKAAAAVAERTMLIHTHIWVVVEDLDLLLFYIQEHIR